MKKIKILVAEDDNILREVIVKKLIVSGYDVEGAEDGVIALEKIKKNKPDLILLDILMPRKGGMEVLEDLNKDEELKKIPVIIVSNSGQPIDTVHARELGVKSFLIKATFDPGEVVEKVRKVLAGESNSEIDSDFSPNAPTYIPGESIKKEEDEIKVTKKKISKDSSKKQVLIVEDDKFLRELLMKKLEKEGYGVDGAIESSEAFSVLSEKTPDLVLLDLILPGMDGFTILGKIKENEKFKKMPVVILSNLGQKEDVDKAMSLGAYGFMIKSNFTLDEIALKVKSILEENK